MCLTTHEEPGLKEERALMNFIFSNKWERREDRLYHMRLDRLGIRASSAISWLPNLGESPTLSKHQFPPVQNKALTDDLKVPLKLCSSFKQHIEN